MKKAVIGLITPLETGWRQRFSEETFDWREAAIRRAGLTRRGGGSYEWGIA